MKRILYFFLGLIAFLSLLCSIAVSCVTNAAMMKQGFLQFSQTEHLSVSASRYGDYAVALVNYLDGKSDLPRVPAYDGQGGVKEAFSEKENAHLADVRGIVNFLKIIRWAGGGLTLLLLLALYIKHKADPAAFFAEVARSFALSALFLLLFASALAVWGIVNFDGLFVTFHKVAFTNDLWLLNPNADLLLALMPLPFFTWYVGEILKSMLPVLGMMLLVIIAWLRNDKKQKETNEP